MLMICPIADDLAQRLPIRLSTLRVVFSHFSTANIMQKCLTKAVPEQH